MKKIVLLLIIISLLSSSALAQTRVEQRYFQAEQELFALNNQYRVRQGLPPFSWGTALGDSLALSACEQAAQKIIDFQEEIEKKFDLFLENNNHNFNDAIDDLITFVQKKYSFYSSLLEQNKKNIVAGLEYYTKYPNQKKYDNYKNALLANETANFYEHFEIGHINFATRSQRLMKQDYQIVSENVIFSSNYFQGQKFLQAYQKSPGHNENLLTYLPNIQSYYVNIITLKVNQYYYNIMLIYGK